MLRLISNDELKQQEDQARGLPQKAPELTGLVAFLNRQWQTFRNHNKTHRLRNRCTDALRVYQGKYSEEKLAQIKQFGGSEVFSNITSVKVLSRCGI